MSGFAKRAARAVVPRSLWARAHTLRALRRVARFPRRVVEHAYGPHRLRVLLADDLGAGWYDHDWADPPELALFRGRSLRPGTRVFDLGAHQAIVALMLERETRPGGTVVAVELNDHNARVAAENVRLNEPAAVVVVHAAAGEHVGFVEAVWGLNASLSSSGHGAKVSAVTVDELARTYGEPDLVYVDVEGYECQVLRGSSETLGGRVDFFIEVHAYGALQDAGGSLDELLERLGDRELLAMRESDTGFSPLPSELPQERFFLAALARGER